MAVSANVARVDYHCSMTVQDAYRQLSITLQTIYERREANHIASFVIESLTGFNNTQRIVHKDVFFTRQQTTNFHLIIMELLDHKPVQYVLQEAHWYGMKLYVDNSVLIPRPETEELVAWCIEKIKEKHTGNGCEVLDIGTGSGCIAIAVKKSLPSCNVYAADISDKALEIAMQNAEEQGTDISFYKTDMLDTSQWTNFPDCNCIISNPPYVTEQEASHMDKNVLRFEPHLALFVPDNNPLVFYDAISSFGQQHLHNNGLLFFEINESFGREIADMLSAKGYTDVELRKDMQGKDRMVKGEAPNP